MNHSSLISLASFSPKHLHYPNAWIGHLPFAGWLIGEVVPNIFVELGTHSGNSYFSFCQAVKEKKLPTKCYAIDTWRGDEHAGFYEEEIYSQVNAYNQENYLEFSRLLRMTFDQAIEYFSDETVDLLHIDGLHTYDAVKHDFETWLPKLTPGAVVMFHDINVRENDFGVWKLWEELQQKYPLNIEFTHSHGLGVIQLDNGSKEKQLPWLAAGSSEQLKLKYYFAELGSRQLERFDLINLQKEQAESKKTIDDLQISLSGHGETINELRTSVDDLNKEIGKYHTYAENLKTASVVSDEKIVSLNGLLAASRKLTADLNYKVSVIGADADQQREERERLETILAEHRSQLAHYRERVAAHEETLRAFHNTRTWRMTKPLRSAANTIRRFRNKYLRQPRNGSAQELIASEDSDGKSNEAAVIVIEQDTSQSLMRYLVDSVSKIHHPEQKFAEHNVAVIVPVYRGVFETERCLHSVLNSNNKTGFKVIVINDSSPEPQMDEMLKTLHYPNLIILKNDENLGFVKTVNRGMKYAENSDVILLNSDTMVSGDWVDRLVNQAYSNENVGTVTPFSNNATICSYPNLEGWAALPANENLSQIDSAFAKANFGKSIEIPTAVGFCMFIKRDCLDDTGLFDEDAFGKGYGEENDFCLRARLKGWKNILAADTFIFHEGEVSFSETALAGKANAMNIIRSRYPDYEDKVISHIRQNQAYQYQVAATAARYRLGNAPVIMMVTHGLDGGTEKHIQELSRFLTENGTKVLILRPGVENKVSLESFNEKDCLHLDLSADDLKLLGETLKTFGVRKIHIHHTIGFNFSIEQLLSTMEMPYDYTAHDYFSICPRIYLINPNYGYCGVPPTNECTTCLLSEPQPGGHYSIYWWRAKFGSLLNGAEKVICPSQDTANRIAKVYPSAKIIVIPHEEINAPPPAAKFQVKGKRRRFAILGVLGEQKGLNIAEKLIEEISSRQLDIELFLIGYVTRPLNTSENFFQTGNYLEKDIYQLIDRHNPDGILFLSQCPETYSYTLSVAIQSGKTIIAPDLGSFPERLKGIANAHIFPSEFDEQSLANYLNSIELISESSDTSKSARAEISINQFYKSDQYWETDARKASVPTLLIIPEMIGVMPSPCSYIRLIQPLLSSNIQREFKLRVGTIEEISTICPDIVVTNRLSCRNSSELEILLKAVRRTEAKLVYDIDDNLLQLHDSHPEKVYYESKKDIILKLLEKSDCVWTSTEKLAEYLQPLCGKILTIKNYLEPDFLETRELKNLTDGRFKILYMGTSSHRNDLAQVLIALRKLAHDGFDFELNLIGIDDTKFAEEWIKGVSLPANITNYSNFVKWLGTFENFNLGIAPLEESLFNECKSDIKFWDYTAMGVPTLASNIGAYSLIINNGENGLLADSANEDWIEKITWAMNNRQQLSGLTVNAARKLKEISMVRSAETERRASLAEIIKSS